MGACTTLRVVVSSWPVTGVVRHRGRLSTHTLGNKTSLIAHS